MNSPLVIGVDPGSRDWTVLGVFERSLVQASERFNLIAVEVVDKLTPTIERLSRRLAKMQRERLRPRGYSQSHWRKLWKQRQGLGKSEGQQ